MRWPWFVDLQIERILKGQAPKGRLTVLTVQHTWHVASRSFRWHLRRNELGGFNVVEGGDPNQLNLCPSGAPPVRPYIQPKDGRTLADLMKEGEQRYGDGPPTRP